MHKGKKILAIIPLRGGSKGLPGKNIRLLGGKPLLAWAFDSAKQVTIIDKIIINTDSLEIQKVANTVGAETPFLRPPELATDQATTHDVLVDTFKRCPGYDFFALLQATTPFSHPEEIEECIKTAIDHHCMTVTVTHPKFPPHRCLNLKMDLKMEPLFDIDKFMVRQNIPETVVLNGACYVAPIDLYLEKKSYFTPETRGIVMPFNRSIDIDTLDDFQWAEYLVEKSLI